MAEAFLEEQLKRIRKMAEQMSRARKRAAELSEEIERERASITHGPLGDNRDLRSYDSPELTPDRADDHGGRRRSRESPRRRRRS
jgi:hypothetical protein